ncbi:peptidase family M50 [Methanobrevibacter cuticularis]|uniref:Peptidase family M50 n=1 Tax=Methanobrevibacter cuticularis TaxID=47311 RepID=A0A166E4A4_9EURY|nr:metalloprotease [Methanobrevibacter cuticularis]KZX16264.1 peptidase family M50 [Methanobrevibacter cuticularis]
MFKFTSNEIKDLFIAFFVISVAFSILYSRPNYDQILYLLPMIMVGVGLGFILHEIAHKFVAMHYGYWAEFKNWLPGLFIALISPIFGFIFAAPGAVHIYGEYMTDRENGIISLSGPLTNIALGLLFFVLFIITSISINMGIITDPLIEQILTITFTLGFAINSWLALFNLIPFSVLDGAKIIRWNPLIWLGTAAVAGFMVYISLF